MPTVSYDLKGRHFTRVADWERPELEAVLDLADELKTLQHQGEEHHLLPGRTLGMIFQKPSTRTRVSFEVGIAQLVGAPVADGGEMPPLQVLGNLGHVWPAMLRER